MDNRNNSSATSSSSHHPSRNNEMHKSRRPEEGMAPSMRGYEMPPPDSKRPRYKEPQHQQEERQQRQRRGGYTQREPSRYDDYYRPSSPRETDRKSTSDWKCLECKTWNYPDERTCARCGDGQAPPGHASSRWKEEDRKDERSNYYRGNNYNEPDPYDDRLHRYNRDHNNDYYHSNQANYYSYDGGPDGRGPPMDKDEKEEQEEELDEFGRVSIKLPSAVKKKKKQERREWPLHFEQNGSAFTFDSRSAMFYEAESDFFYDPKSKFYYSNKSGHYYRYNSELDPPFEEVAVQASSGATTDLEPVLAAASDRPKSSDSTSTTGASKKSIAIKLKTKSLKPKKTRPSSSAASSSATASSTTGRFQKSHATDMEKWSERQQEQKQETATRAGEEATNKSAGDVTEIAKTSKGEVICLLCRRKFPNLDKLSYHEQVSKLHKENLAKKKQQLAADKKTLETAKDTSSSSNSNSPPAATSTKKNPTTTYVDRAQHRRNLYGPESSNLPVPITAAATIPSADNSDALTEVPLQPDMAEPTEFSQQQQQHDPLGEGTVGHKMLQKLGWDAGSMLGRGAVRSTATASQHVEQHEAITRDWDRIESIAASSQQQQRGRPTTSYGRGVTKNGGIGSNRKSS